ncbi:MAG: alanine racemase [Bacteroidales bacterium]|nr:alanine racemase [Bacteroidales bacterium]
MSKVTEPVLLLDEQKCRNNIQRMADKAKRSKIRLRPHFKTHQSRQIAEWFREAGISCITVSSLRMATYFAEQGWDDITVAFPVNTLEHERINRLASKLNINLLVADLEAALLLSQVVKYPVRLWIKVDSGSHRTGVLPEDKTTINAILEVINGSRNLSFSGFLTHAGQSYNCRSRDEIMKVHRDTSALMRELSDSYRSAYPDHEISTGDTPTCSIAEDFGIANEIRPGNFVFYDLTQALVSSCEKREIAVAVACPVVARHADRNEIILYGGGIHFSKESLDQGDGRKIFGELVWVNDEGWGEPEKECYVTKLSQEHGILRVTDEVFRRIAVGDVVAILPVHSCMTANLLAGYTTLTGERFEYFDAKKEYFI